jgi:hypothetical protein
MEGGTMHGDIHDILKIAAGVLIALTIRGVFLFSFDIVQEITDNPNAVKVARWVVLLSLVAGAAVIWLAVR